MKRTDKRVRFCVTAGKRYGLGHLRRCLTLSELLIEKGLKRSNIEFYGDFDEESLFILDASGFVGNQSKKRPSTSVDLVVIDRMFDAIDAEYYDADEINRISEGSQRRLLICSSRTLPSGLSVDLVVGYLFEQPIPGYEVRWGMKYAPVHKRVGALREGRAEVSDDLRRCLIAFGNWGDSRAAVNCLRALRRINFEGEVVMVTPPAQREFLGEFEVESKGLNIWFVNRPANLLEMVKDADLLLGSYGLLTYEALTIGTATIVVPVKPFMAEYGASLGERGFLRLASTDINGNENEIIAAVNYVRPALIRREMRKKCDETFDGLGLNRLAELMVE